MELIAFGAMAAGAYVALLSRHRAVVYGWFILFAVYALAAHLSPAMTTDMTRYHEFAHDWPPPLNTLTLREPVFYFFYPVVHVLTGNGTVTFLIFDLLGGVIVMHAMKTLDDDGSDYMLALAPTIISSYVFLLGQQNVLRQHLATIILLWSLAARARHRRSAFPLLVLSFLAHNMTAVTLGCWWDAGRTRHRYGPLITAAGVILIGLFLPVLGKSYLESTGMRTEYLYLLVAGILGLILLFRDAPRPLGRRPSALLNFIAFAPAVAILPSTHFERMAMIFLVLILVELYGQYPSLQIGWPLAARLAHALRSQRRASPAVRRAACSILSHLRRSFAAHVAYALLVIPTFLFPSARGMLL